MTSWQMFRKKRIDERISIFKRNMHNLSYDVMANPIGVKGIGKYEVKDEESPFSKYKKGAPVHVKAAINYNSLIDHWYEGKRYEKITNGTKSNYGDINVKQLPTNRLSELYSTLSLCKVERR